MMDKDTYLEIAGKIADGTASEREIELYNAYFNAYQLKYPSWNELDALQRKEMIDEAEEGIHVQLRHDDDKRSVRLWPRMAVAAAAVAAIVFGVWFFSSKYQDASIRNGSTASVNDIAPGKNGATITLGNGKVIALSDAKTGVLIGEQGIRYDDNTAVMPSAPAQNLTASTARGQTYQFTLPDGTRVWLNADSKISFPSQFSGENRKILLEGEGYFEVAKDNAHPFIVGTRRQQIEVLGTHFNVSAYANDVAMKTTLFEGKVAVTEDGSRLTLHPGDQAYSGLDGVRALTLENPEAEIDWKNGDFVFERESLAEIMQKVSRWYDVGVVFDADVDQQQTFGGKVSRKRNISQVIKALQATQALKFKIEGKKVYVSN